MKYIMIILMALLTLPARSQFLRADFKKAMELKQRPLVVVLFDPETEASTQCDSMHMAWYNEHIAVAFEKHWTLNDSIIFMESRKAASIIDSKSHEYVIFTAGPSREGQQSSGDVFWYPSFTFMVFLSEDGNRMNGEYVDRGFYNERLVPDTEVTGQLNRGRYIFKLSLPEMMISENDLAFVLQQFDISIGKALEEKKAKGGIYASPVPRSLSARLKNDTLLIPETFDPEASDQKIISSYYNHPFKIASEKQIEDAQSGAARNQAFIHYLWSDHERMFLGFVVETETLDVITAFKPGQVKLEKAACLPAGKSYRTLIRAKARYLKRL